MDDSKDSAYVKEAKARESAFFKGANAGDGGWQLGCIAGIVLVGILGYTIFGGKDDEGPPDYMKIVVAQEAVRGLLRDPGSAEFRNEKFGSHQGSQVVCGEVNSTNGFGGRNGYQRYISNGGAATVLEENMAPAEFSTTWSTLGC